MTAAELPAILAFTDVMPAGVDRATLLGGKGAGLVEMTQALGLPVPPGFVITTPVCRRYLEAGWPDGLDEQIATHLHALGHGLGRRFADPTAPFLVSVRSGAPISMPGMMDTLLNVGITPAIREALAEATGNALFAADTWLRFCRMYAEIVLGLPRAVLGDSSQRHHTPEAALAEAERIREAARAAGSPIPDDPFDQVRGAAEAVFASWNSERARAYRAHEGIAVDLGTAVTVQAMVFGNLDDRSGSGVVFTRDPSTGANEPFGDYLARGQGEDVVAGTHAVHGLGSLRTQLPEVYSELQSVLGRLERHYRDMCDVEFTVSDARLYVLQTRVGKRSPFAAVRIAVEMAQDPQFPLSTAEAVRRVDEETIRKLSAAGSVRAGSVSLAKGLAASPGVGAGVLCCDPHRALELAAAGAHFVLARRETSPEDVPAMIGAAAILTTLGGVASHAAVVARGWAIPAVTSLEGADVSAAGLRLGDRFIAEGETVTVDGGAGLVYAGDCRSDDAQAIPELAVLRTWGAELQAGAAAPAAPHDHDADVSPFAVARAIQLKGLCSVDRAAATIGCGPERVTAAVAAAPGRYRETPRGWALTPEGRAWVLEQLKLEREAGQARSLDDCYARFLEINTEFKQLVTGWQTGDAAEEGRRERMVTSLEAIDGRVQPLVEESARWFSRLRRFSPRFADALGALHAGDDSMLASPMKESYHTIWFEFHEELIALSGRDRATEEE